MTTDKETPEWCVEAAREIKKVVVDPGPWVCVFNGEVAKIIHAAWRGSAEHSIFAKQNELLARLMPMITFEMEMSLSSYKGIGAKARTALSKNDPDK